MPYRLTYSANVEYAAPGIGLGMAVPINAGSPGNVSGSLTFYFSQTVQPSSNTFTNTDVVNLLNAMVADLTAQMENSATQQKIQNAATFSAVPPPGGN